MLVTETDLAIIGDGVLNLSTNLDILEQHLVDTKTNLPLSQNDYPTIPYDKKCCMLVL